MGAGFSAATGKIPRPHGGLLTAEREILDISAAFSRTGSAWLLPLVRGEHHVFRAAVLSLALTLAGGPNITLRCSISCHPQQQAMSSACTHQKAIPSLRVSGEDGCRSPAAAATAFVRDETKRESHIGGAQQAVVTRLFRFVPLSADTGRPNDSNPSPGAPSPSFQIPLRI